MWRVYRTTNKKQKGAHFHALPFLLTHHSSANYLRQVFNAKAIRAIQLASSSHFNLSSESNVFLLNLFFPFCLETKMKKVEFSLF